MDAVTVDRLTHLYPMLEAIPVQTRERVLTYEARRLQVPGATLLFDQGSPCQGFPLVLDGSVRVARGSAGGRTLELYRVTPGEICVVSASCLFGHSAVAAHGETTEPTDLVLLSPAGFDRCAENPEFRRFVFGIFADRLADLMALAEAVAFQRLDQRLAHALLGRGAVVRATHQTLADELGTVREIVSRLLARFERAGWVALSRERIDIRDSEALRALAAGASMI
jgi:CRP/FNR family transcriptional regulator